MLKKTFPHAPMGWNSYDYYDTTVNEEQIKANADYMHKHLKAYGWEYIVVDIQWYAPNPASQRAEHQYIPFHHLVMDDYSRLLPCPERFPSSANGAGFKPLADYIHSLGLKFGIHIMRGVPRQAAHNHTGLLNTDVTANIIANPSSISKWNPDMYGVKATPEGQLYYDSLIELYTSWGVDFIKCDDIANTNMYVDAPYSGQHEIEMLYNAIEKSPRDIVLSLSPGPALIDKAWHYHKHATMWRITDDFWDDWPLLLNMFERCELWERHVGNGSYPDCDMLPIGYLGKGFHHERLTQLTHDEQMTMMSLWCIFRSPLMIGAELTRLDDWTLTLLTKERLLDLLDEHWQARQLLRTSTEALWMTHNVNTDAVCIGMFNLSDEEKDLSIPLSDIGVDITSTTMTEIWTDKPILPQNNHISLCVPPHGARLIFIQ